MFLMVSISLIIIEFCIIVKGKVPVTIGVYMLAASVSSLFQEMVIILIDIRRLEPVIGTP